MVAEAAAGDRMRFRVRRSPRLRAYLLLGGLALLAAVAAGRPEGVALAMPFLLSVALAGLLTHPPEVSIACSLTPERTMEGRTVTFQVRLVASGQPVQLQVLMQLPDELAETGRPTGPLRLLPGQPATLERTLHCRRWGALRVGELVLVTAGPLTLVRFEAQVSAALPLRVYPRPEPVHRVPRPRHTQAFAGNALARRTGDGIEFADIRAFAPGDSLRHVNWRISAKARTLAVNVQHLERNVDVILFLDAFTEIGGAASSTLDRTLSAASGLAAAVLGRRDRVGVISYGGTLRWLAPGMGTRQRWRIADTLIDTRIEPSYAWKSIGGIPARILPPDALIIGLTPLHDQRIVDALLEARGRGHDVAVLEVSPDSGVVSRPDPYSRLAARVWRMQREAARSRLRTAGLAVATWETGRSLQAAIAEVRAFRRSMRFPA
jgi:uncharacterized protein (DUF58 family)